MRYGSPWSAGWGQPEDMVVDRRVVPVGPRFDIWFTPHSGYGNAWFGIYRDAKFIKNVYAREGVPTYVSVPRDRGQTRQSILVLRIGCYADVTYAIRRVARTYESDNAARFTLDWTWTPEVIGAIGDNGKTSSWAFSSGLTWKSVLKDPSMRTRGYYNVTLEVSGSDITIAGDSGGTTKFSGTGSFPGSISLTGDITGSVTVASGATSATGVKVYVRWPHHMAIKRNVSGPNYVEVDSVLFNQEDVASWTETSDLAAGGQNYKLRPYSDTGDAGTESGVLGGTIPQHPEPPTNLAYVSGDASATDISWTASVTSGVTYNVYVGQPGLPVDLTTPAATGVTGTTTTLPALTGYPGIATVIVRTVKSGGEEKNSEILFLEYDGSGNYVPPRPNTPAIDAASAAVTGGTTLDITGVYDPTNQAGVATKLQLFKRTPTGSYDFTTVDAEAALTASPFHITAKTADLSFSFSSAGFYYVTLKAATADDVQSTDPSDEVLVYVSAVDAAAPTDTAISVSRG